MSSQPIMRVWFGIVAVVALAVSVIAQLLPAVQRRSRSALWRRTLRPQAVIAASLILFSELSWAVCRFGSIMGVMDLDRLGLRCDGDDSQAVLRTVPARPVSAPWPHPYGSAGFATG